jgi:DNA invertase Pin-like site-specific DNA recombinase
MLVGYARVSTDDQTLDPQNDALTKAGCQKIFTDIASGAKTDRAGLREALDYLRAGDTLVVWKLDRLGRSLKHLIETVNLLEEKKAGFKSLTEQMDTTSPGGRLFFHVFGALAEFERALIRERTQAGLKAARVRGRKGGRRREIDKIDPRKIARAKELYAQKDMPVKEIMAIAGIRSRTTFYRYIPEKPTP